MHEPPGVAGVPFREAAYGEALSPILDLFLSLLTHPPNILSEINRIPG